MQSPFWQTSTLPFSTMIGAQTFQSSDLAVVGFLVLLEALLSADNALIMAIMVRHLPKPDQKRALFYGLGGAFVFRFVAILLARQVLLLWWLQAIGALYLLAMPVKHFREQSEQSEVKAKGGSFWGTVVAVELADIAFAIDSVLAGVAMIRSQSKIWVVFTGAAIGIVLLRFAANAFIKLLAKYPMLDDVAYVLVGWVGVKLCFTSVHNFGEAVPDALPFKPHEMTDFIFWTVMGLIAVIGSIRATRKGHKENVATLLREDESSNL